MFSFELTGSFEKVEGSDAFIMRMKKGEQVKHCAFSLECVDLSVTEEDLKEYSNYDGDTDKLKKHIFQKKRLELLKTLHMGICALAGEFLENNENTNI